MPAIEARTKVSDIAIWYKHLDSREMVACLEALEPEEEITLSVDGVVGRWRRMRTGRDGRRVNAIRPTGPMKDHWGALFRRRRGAVVTLAVVADGDDFLQSASALFSEWNSPEDEAAFRDL